MWKAARVILSAVVLVLGGCADVEKMRYIDNSRVIGNATQTEVAEFARTTGEVSAWVGFQLLRAALGWYDD